MSGVKYGSRNQSVWCRLRHGVAAAGLSTVIDPAAAGLGRVGLATSPSRSILIACLPAAAAAAADGRSVRWSQIPTTSSPASWPAAQLSLPADENTSAWRRR